MRRPVNVKRTLFITHRWAGILLCLFMALWFVSGVVLMYVCCPKLSMGDCLRARHPGLDDARPVVSRGNANGRH